MIRVTHQPPGPLSFREHWLNLSRQMMHIQVHRCYPVLERLGAGPTELQDLAWTTYASNVYRENGEHDG